MTPVETSHEHARDGFAIVGMESQVSQLPACRKIIQVGASVFAAVVLEVVLQMLLMFVVSIKCVLRAPVGALAEACGLSNTTETDDNRQLCCNNFPRNTQICQRMVA